jgi:hypothetical protein
MRVNKKGTVIPIMGCAGSWNCEISRFPHFIDNPLTDGGEVISLMSKLPKKDSWNYTNS